MDLRIFEDVSLAEQKKEFLERLRNKDHLPVLTSSCPGWICYAEKTHGSWILPYISRVKSAQQIAGSFVKDHLSRTRFSDSNVYHVTLMPCFDKKLEASRADFQDEVKKDVDLVITTVEIEQMLAERNLSLNELSSRSLDSVFDAEGNSIGLSVNPGSGSGGYSENVFLHAASEIGLFEESKSVNDLELKTVRNADFFEVSASSEDASLKFGIANGFKNIQNLVQKLKRKRCDYQFVEVMACPGGCLNGGAQARPIEDDPAGILAKENLKALKLLHKEMSDRNQIFKNEETISRVQKEWLGGGDSDKAKALLYTQYHEVEKMSNALAIKW